MQFCSHFIKTNLLKTIYKKSIVQKNYFILSFSRKSFINKSVEQSKNKRSVKNKINQLQRSSIVNDSYILELWYSHCIVIVEIK